MCFPGMGLIAGGLSALGTLYSGATAAASYKAQAGAYQAQAKQVDLAGMYQAGRVKQQVNQTIGQQIAGIGGSGVQLSGSAVDAIGSTASEGQMDIDTVKWNAFNQANNLEYSAKVAKQNARAAQIGGFIGAAGGIADSINKTWTSGATRLGVPWGAPARGGVY